ncbi:hypothetical protein ABK040_008114 [Willaertia magna]
MPTNDLRENVITEIASFTLRKHLKNVLYDQENFYKILESISMNEITNKITFILQNNTLENLPNEILEVIFLFLENDDKSWLNINLCCKRFNEICNAYRYQEIPLTLNNKTFKYIFYQGQPGQYYLTLPKPENNISTYIAPSRMHGKDTDVITKWFKVRIDVNNLKLNTGDYRFTKSKGFSYHHMQTHVAYGSCFGCEAPHVADGHAKCDLTGTPFKFNKNHFGFKHEGYLSNGTWEFKENDQIVDLKGGGYCGWTTSTVAKNEDEAVAGGWFITLDLLLKNVDTASAAATSSSSDETADGKKGCEIY